MGETIARQELVIHLNFAAGLDQLVASLQLLGEGSQQRSLADALHTGYYLSGKSLTLDAGHSQGIVQLRLKTGDALLDDRFDAGGQRLPIQRWAHDPVAFGVAHQVPASLHSVQQLNCEQRVTLGLVVEGGSESLVQSVGVGVEQGVDKRAAHGRLQVDPDVTVCAFQLIDHWLQRVAFTTSAQGDFVGAVGDHQQDAITG